MPWTPKQIKLAGMAARSAGWCDGDEQNLRTVLRWFGNRAVQGGKLTRKSPKLNNDDFEFYMSIAEAAAGGVLPGWKPGHWRNKAGQVIHRQRDKILGLLAELNLSGDEPYLNGIINKATGGKAVCLDDVDQLNDRAVAGKVIDALKYQVKRRGRSGSQTAEARTTQRR